MPCAVLADEIRAGHVRALLVRVGNPALAIAGQPALREVLRSLDLLVAIDVRPTETTAVATHVLPMTDHLERGDLLSGYLQAQPFLRYAPPVLAPVGERRPQWWVFAELARRLGMPMFGSARRDAALADRDVDDEVVAESIMASARRPWSEVRAEPYGIRDDSVAPGWLVPSRLPQRLDVAPVELVAQLATARPGAGRPDTARLVLINRRTPQQYNSLHREVVGRGRPAAPSLLVHPDDAAPRRLQTGDVAVISTAHGECRAVVEVTDTIRPGVVSLPHGFGDANVNRVMSTADADPLSGMTIVSGLEVDVTRADVPVAAAPS